MLQDTISKPFLGQALRLGLLFPDFASNTSNWCSSLLSSLLSIEQHFTMTVLLGGARIICPCTFGEQCTLLLQICSRGRRPAVILDM